jgi:membrane associated rhomboid family serine protease
MLLPLSVQIRWREDRPPLGVAGLIVGMGLLHLAGWAAIEWFGWPHDWRFQMLGLDLGDPSAAALVTNIFAHANAMHYLGNMIFLWVFGAPLENRLGTPRFLAAFLICGVGSSLLDLGLFQLVLMGEPGTFHSTSLGASGAIMGIMGLSSARFLKAKVRTGGGLYLGGPMLRFPIPLTWFMAWRALQDILGLFTDNGPTNHLAHIFGFAVGFGLARAFGIAKDGTDDVVWDKARDDMDRGWWKQALPNLEAVVGRRPADLEALGDLLLVQVRLCPANPAQASPHRGAAAQTMEQYLSAALQQGRGSQALAQWRMHAPPLSEALLSAKAQTLLRPLLSGRHAQLAAAPVAQEPVLAAPVDGDDRRNQLLRLSQGLAQAAASGDHAEASRLAFRWSQLEDLRHWPPRALAQAWDSGRRANDKLWTDYAEAASRGDQPGPVLEALLALEKAWSATPKHPRLALLVRQAGERLVPLYTDAGFTELKARVERV